MLSTSTKEISLNSLHVKIPIINYPTNKWTNLYINIFPLIAESFKSMTLLSIDYIKLSANCKIRKIFALKNFSELPVKGLNLPSSIEVANIKIENLQEGLVEFDPTENGQQNGIEDSIGSTKEKFEGKKIKMKSKSKNTQHRGSRENGSVNNYDIVLNGGVEGGLKNSNSKNNIGVLQQQNVRHIGDIQKEYVSLSKKTKDNIRFAKKIPNIEQLQNQIRYEQKSKKLPSHHFGSLSPTKNTLSKGKRPLNSSNVGSDYYDEGNGKIPLDLKRNTKLSKDERSPPLPPKNIKTNNFTNNSVKGSKSPIKMNNFNIVANAKNSKSPLKKGSEKNVKNNSVKEEKDEKLLSTFNLNNNNSSNNKVTNLCDSIEEIYDFCEGGNLGEESILNNKASNNNNIIHIDKQKVNFDNNASKGKSNFSKNDFGGLVIDDDLLGEDQSMNFTLESNRPFTPPITRLVPVGPKNNNLIGEKDKKKNNLVESNGNYYSNLIFDKEKGCYYNPKTNIYYDLKD